MPEIPAAVIDAVSAAAEPIDAASCTAVAGGSINRSFVVVSRHGERYFLKLNGAARHEMFVAEFAGLTELAAASSVRVPEPVAHGVAADTAWLLMEHLQLAQTNSRAEAKLGARLADQHRHTAATFGWQRDNTIGSTLQLNTPDDDWLRFFAERRLRHQLEIARERGFAATLAEPIARLIDGLQDFFVDHAPEPSLLHGDLWGGNWGALDGGEPVIFDPAVYYGDREADLAMTRLFGGFGDAFYAAYQSEWPLDAGFTRRCNLYNLYHVLNHLNLFGGGYLGQAESMLERLLRT